MWRDIKDFFGNCFTVYDGPFAHIFGFILFTWALDVPLTWIRDLFTLPISDKNVMFISGIIIYTWSILGIDTIIEQSKDKEGR